MRLVIFDLDGVLVDSKDVHFSALNRALESVRPGSSISRTRHLAVFDGLDTQAKLEILVQSGQITRDDFQSVWELKQEFTAAEFEALNQDPELIAIFRELKANGFRIAVASNSIRHTVATVITSLGIIQYVDLFLGNEDVKSRKPHPEIYWTVMSYFGVLPEETMVIEDSPIGRESARRSGARVLEVFNRAELSLELVKRVLMEKRVEPKMPWSDSELNVVIPMAGAGQRFVDAGYTFPKPIIEVQGKPMIQRVVENLNINAHYIFIVQTEMNAKFNLAATLRQIVPNCTVVESNGLTQGAAETVLLASHLIDSGKPLLLANSDQLIEWDPARTLYKWRNSEVAGGILTFESTHPKWSYAALNDLGHVVEVAEKKPISSHATVGIYYWQRGSDFIRCAKTMIKKDIRTNGEFYVCPVFNEIIGEGAQIAHEEVSKMYGIGTPEDLQSFLLSADATRLLAQL